MGLAASLLLCPGRAFRLFFASVSFVYLSYLPEFRATTTLFGYSSSSLLLCSLSLGLVGVLPDVLLLVLLICPVHALRLSISRTPPVSAGRRTLFVSPRSPSRSLSQSALRFSRASSSSSPDSASCRSLSFSSSHLPSVHAVFVGLLLLGPFLLMLRFLLSWLRPLVLLPGGFQYFYLRVVQFSSSCGFGWGLVVAAGDVMSLVVYIYIYMCISFVC